MKYRSRPDSGKVGNRPPPTKRRVKSAEELERENDERRNEKTRNESERAISAVNSYTYSALRMYHYRTWPDQGEIRDELDRLSRLPGFELDDLLRRAGFDTRDQAKQNNERLRISCPDAADRTETRD